LRFRKPSLQPTLAPVMALFSFRGSKKRDKSKEKKVPVSSKPSNFFAPGTDFVRAKQIPQPFTASIPLELEAPARAPRFSWSSSSSGASPQAAGRDARRPSLRSTLSYSSFSDPFDTTSTPPPFTASSHEQQLSAIVVGAGFGGLSAAIGLARQGWQVKVFEKSGLPSKHGDCLTVSFCRLAMRVARTLPHRE